ncbi:DUF6414 family protein [Halococcus salsus]|uniref:DUF6414 family protein n=1 Tax=Halococcus salsus TaxID=2162894 RepID=UPI00135CAE1C|nr:hypothetical protein [Halococcus salsus]
MSISGMPDVYYLDEPRVQQQMQMIHQGQVQKVVETVSSTDSSENEGRVSIYEFLDYHRGSSEENIEDFSRTVQSTPIGQFIAFHGVLDTVKEDLTHLSRIDNNIRNSLEDGDYVTIEGKIERPPWTQLYDLAERLGIDLSDVESGGPEMPDDSEERLLEELEDAARYYQVSMNGECDGCFVFKLWEENMLSIARDFPNNFKDYTVFAKIDHIYEQGEERHYLDFLDEMPTKDRKEQTERRIRKKQLANELDPLYMDGVDDADLHISPPDIVLTPVAIYA